MIYWHKYNKLQFCCNTVVFSYRRLSFLSIQKDAKAKVFFTDFFEFFFHRISRETWNESCFSSIKTKIFCVFSKKRSRRLLFQKTAICSIVIWEGTAFSIYLSHQPSHSRANGKQIFNDFSLQFIPEVSPMAHGLWINFWIITLNPGRCRQIYHN